MVEEGGAGMMPPPPQTPRMSSGSGAQVPGQIQLGPSTSLGHGGHHSRESRGQSRERDREGRHHSPSASRGHGGMQNGMGQPGHLPGTHGAAPHHPHHPSQSHPSHPSHLPQLTQAQGGSHAALQLAAHQQAQAAQAHQAQGGQQVQAHGSQAPQPQGGPLLLQLDQLRAIQRQQDLLLRQEQAHLLGLKSAHSGPSPPADASSSRTGSGRRWSAGGA